MPGDGLSYRMAANKATRLMNEVMRKVPESDEENAVTSDMPRRRIVLGRDVTQAAAYVEHMANKTVEKTREVATQVGEKGRVAIRRIGGPERVSGAMVTLVLLFVLVLLILPSALLKQPSPVASLNDAL